MRKANVLKKQIEQMKKGESIYINAIGLTISCANLLREYLQKGILVPNAEELEQFIKPEFIEKYLNGECICPQMTYTKC